MKSRVAGACAALLLGLVASPAVTAAQTPDTALDLAAAVDTEPPVIQYDLSGPRVGVTFMPNGLGTRSQFGWHFENQASPAGRGPWFIVERVLLIGGVENKEFVPSGTVVFGVRLPNSFEFGVGPSISLGPATASTAVVAAAGQTFRYGGIRVPVNLAVAMNRDTYRVTLISGWAIRDPASRW